MKKILILLLSLSVFCAMPSLIFAKNSKNVNLDFKLDYKVNIDEKIVEHEMKNEIQLLSNGKWKLASKMQSSKNNDIVLLLTRIVSQKNNEFTVQFMLIDSSAHQPFIIEPKIIVLAGLPARLSIHEQNRDIEFSVLAVSNSQ